jgi:hypothetical protein
MGEWKLSKEEFEKRMERRKHYVNFLRNHSTNSLLESQRDFKSTIPIAHLRGGLKRVIQKNL